MTTVYVREHGAVVRKQGEQLLVTQGQQITLKIPVAELTQLVLMGNVQLTTPAAVLLLRMEVDVVLMSYNGTFYGRLNLNTSKFAELRHLHPAPQRYRSALAMGRLRPVPWLFPHARL